MTDTEHCIRSICSVIQLSCQDTGNKCSSSVTSVKIPPDWRFGHDPSKALLPSLQWNAKPAGTSPKTRVQWLQHTAQAKTTPLTPGHRAPWGTADTESRWNGRHKLPIECTGWGSYSHWWQTSSRYLSEYSLRRELFTGLHSVCQCWFTAPLRVLAQAPTTLRVSLGARGASAGWGDGLTNKIMYAWEETSRNTSKSFTSNSQLIFVPSPFYLLFMKVYIIKVKVIHCWRSIKLLLATWRGAQGNVVLPPYRLPLGPTPPTHTAFPQAPSTPHTVFTTLNQIWVSGVSGRAGECLDKKHAQISLPGPSHGSWQHHSHCNQRTG